MKRTPALTILVVLTIGQLALCFGSMRNDSATADEGFHISSGYIKLVYGRLDFAREQPPLMNSMSAMPLVVTGYRFPLPPLGHSNPWGIGRDYLFNSGYDSDRILFLARLPTLLLFVALSWTVYSFTVSETGSRAWGIAAFALTAFCPTLIAHGRVVSVDMAAGFFCFLSAILLIRLVRTGDLITGVAFGASVGAGILSKTSALILGPWSLAVLVVAFMTRQIAPGNRRRVLAAIALAVLTAILVAEVVVLSQASDAYVQRQFPGSARLTLPFREIAANVAAIRTWLTGPVFVAQFLHGRYSQDGWWYYYPVALLIKLTIPALIICATGIALLVRRKATFAAASMLLFVAMFLAAAASARLALGVRYVLPLLPFLYSGAILVISGTAGRKLATTVMVLITWHVGEAFVSYPSYISYFNQSIGSHRNADRYLIDSNLDWGQDLRRLDHWCRESGLQQIAITYFGGGNIDTDLSIRTIPVWSVDYARDIPAGSHFAVSRHLYRLSFWPVVSPRSWQDVLRERQARFITTIGGSIDVYEVPR